MLELLDQFTDEDWELLVLAMLYDVYRLTSPRLTELLYKLECRERTVGGQMKIAVCACGQSYYHIQGQRELFEKHITTDSSPSHHWVWTADWIDTVYLEREKP